MESIIFYPSSSFFRKKLKIGPDHDPVYLCREAHVPREAIEDEVAHLVALMEEIEVVRGGIVTEEIG